jgi:hypothetical protein
MLQIGRPYVLSKCKDYPKFQAVAIAIQRSGFKVIFCSLEVLDTQLAESNIGLIWDCPTLTILWICLIHLRGFTKASNICADRVATKACTFTSVQHVELPVICHSCWCWRVHAGFLVGNDGMLPLVTFLHFMSSLLMASLGFMSRLPQMVGEKKKGSVAVWRHQATGAYYIWLIETLLCNYLLHCLHNCNHLFVCIICCVRLCFISKCAVFLWYLFDTKSILLIIYLHRKLCELWLLTAYSCH